MRSSMVALLAAPAMPLLSSTTDTPGQLFGRMGRISNTSAERHCPLWHIAEPTKPACRHQQSRRVQYLPTHQKPDPLLGCAINYTSLAVSPIAKAVLFPFVRINVACDADRTCSQFACSIVEYPQIPDCRHLLVLSMSYIPWSLFSGDTVLLTTKSLSAFTGVRAINDGAGKG
nr:hypothetical protein CFP56_01169 [Quercus suber]